MPWHQSFDLSSQFCRHNLFITHPILIRIQVYSLQGFDFELVVLIKLTFQMIWIKRFEHLRFFSTSGLGADGSDKRAPPSPQEMQRRIFDQCSRARAILEKARIPMQCATRQLHIYGQFQRLARSGRIASIFLPVPIRRGSWMDGLSFCWRNLGVT